MPSKDRSGWRKIVDRFFDVQARKKQEVIEKELTGEKITERWGDLKKNISIKSQSGIELAKGALPESARKKIEEYETKEEIQEEEIEIVESEGVAPEEVEIGAWSRGFVRLTTDYPPITLGIMTAFMLVMLAGIPQTQVNGAMEVYLPKGSPEEALLLEVREYWSTDVVVIYVETENAYDSDVSVNITSRSVLEEMEYIEWSIDEFGQRETEGEAGIVPDDNGETDNIIFTLSISTIIKELNSSNTRAYDAIADNICQWSEAEAGVLAGGACGVAQGWAQGMKDPLVNTDTELGTYEIPDNQQEINDKVDDIPPSVIKKVVRDVNGDGIYDTAVIVFGVSSNVAPPVILDKIQNILDNRAVDMPGRSADEMDSRMDLTGPVPVTQAITERSFQEFWNVFPIGIVLCASMIFALHRRIRAVLICGLPTLYGIFITYGFIGWWGREVTPTIIALGPILMALGVAYGLHLTNRYTEEEGPLQIRMMKAISTTGRAILLSALTTMIGFGSLMYTNLDPVFTVGLSLTLGIFVCLVTTFVMSPALAVWTRYDHKKVESEWHGVARLVTMRSSSVLAGCIVLMLISLVIALPLIKTNIDYLEMVPNDEPSLIGIVKYSRDFNSGALGMVLVTAEFRNDYNSTRINAVDNLDEVDLLVNGNEAGRPGFNSVENVNAISITDLMRTVKLDASVTTFLENVTDDEDISFERTFWELLHDDQISDNEDLQTFILNVFYDSITPQALSMLMKTDDFGKTLIYVDMPLKDIQAMELAVDGVNDIINKYQHGNVHVSVLTGVAAIVTRVNAQLISSQLKTLAICLVLVFTVLSITFRNWKVGLVTSLPVIWVVALEPLTMVGLGQALSLITVMIGSIVIGVGIDFSIHITQRVMERGMNIPSVFRAAGSTAQTLCEATIVTIFGLMCTFAIKITALWWFVFIIMVLLFFSLISAMFLLPAIYATIIKGGGTLGE